MREVGRYVARRMADRAADFHGKVDAPHPTGIDRDQWIAFHGEPLTFLVEEIDPPNIDGMRYRVVGYSDRELTELSHA